jgi:hypothetical protein
MIQDINPIEINHAKNISSREKHQYQNIFASSSAVDHERITWMGKLTVNNNLKFSHILSGK